MRYGLKTKLDRVVDGDTVRLLVDVGFGIYSKQVIRLAGIDCPELDSKDADEKKRAYEAKRFTELFFQMQGQLEVEVTQKDPYGRWVGHVRIANVDLSEVLLREGHAKPYR